MYKNAIIHTDTSIHKNGKTAGHSIIIYSRGVYRKYGFRRLYTFIESDEAEAISISIALDICKELETLSAVINTDSQTTAHIIRGASGYRGKKYQALRNQVAVLLDKIGDKHIHIRWIPRGDNIPANQLAKYTRRYGDQT